MLGLLMLWTESMNDLWRLVFTHYAVVRGLHRRNSIQKIIKPVDGAEFEVIYQFPIRSGIHSITDR